MAASTWSWVGGSSPGNVSSSWTLVAGSGNGQSYPQTGDTAIVTGGTVLLDSGAQLSADTFDFGGSSGVAGLSISNASTLTGNNIVVGAGSAGSGSVTVQSSGLISDTGGLAVGSAGQGVLNVLNGGTVSLTGGGLNVGLASNATGTVVIGGTGAVAKMTLSTATTGVDIGAAGNGTVEVLTGGSLSVLSSAGTLNAITVGDSAGANGYLEVSGSNAVVTMGSISPLVVGNYGTGEVDVLNGGSLSLSSLSGILMGESLGSSGTIKVSGSGATLAAGYPAFGISLGYLGSALLDIENGGAATAQHLSTGLDAGGVGTVDISGLGSTLTVQLQATLGVAGTGIMNVTSSAAASISTLLVGSGATGEGTLAVSSGGHVLLSNSVAIQSGSTISVTGTTSGIDIGGSGSYYAGGINVQAGKVISGSGEIAATVLNNGKIQSLKGSLTSGTLEIAGGITSTTGGTLAVGSNSVLRLDAGFDSSEIVSFGTDAGLILNAPSAVITNNIGTLSTGDWIELNLGSGVSITSASVSNSHTLLVDTSNGGTYELTNVSFAGTPQLVTGVDSASGNSYIQVQAMTYNWTGGNGDGVFGTAANWDSKIVPTGTDAVSFVNNPGTITGNGTAAYIGIGTSGTAYTPVWTFTGGTLTVAGTAVVGSLPAAAGFFGDTVLNGETINAAGSTAIGGPGDVTVTAQGASQITTEGDSIGAAAGQSGSLVVSGTTTKWFEQTGAAVGGVTPGFLTLGSGSGATGAVTVTNNATLSTGGHAILGATSGGTGDATVSTGGVWTVGGAAVVGQGGTGNLSVNGGTLTTSALTTIGSAAGSTGTADVSGGGIWTATGGLVVGQSGTGEVTVSAGTLTSAALSTLGALAGSTGTLAVTAGGLLSNAGQMIVGSAGLGDLSVQGGAMVIANSASGSAIGAIIGNLSGSDGSSVSVTGKGSDWQVDGTLQVGAASNASLSIASGGTVSAASLQAGVASGSSGVITLSGTNTTLTVSGTASIGGSGAGELSVLNGANGVVNGDLNVGQTAGGSGNVDIENGTLSVLGNLNLGSAGPGVLTIGLGSTLMVQGGINGNVFGVLNQYGVIDPPYYNAGITDNIFSSGPQTYDAYMANYGQINIENNVSVAFLTPQLTNGGNSDGILNITAGAALELDADIVSGQSISFASNTGTLIIGFDQLQTIETPPSGTVFTSEANPNYGKMAIGGYAGVISSIHVGDSIVVDTTQAATFVQNGSIISVVENGTTVGTVAFATTAIANTGFAEITDNIVTPPCFAAGTRIRTERGEVAVEDLHEGDRVWSVLGECFETVQWIGVRPVNCRAHPQPEKVQPVVVSANAFGPAQPVRDLVLSPDHALYVNGVLIPVKQLVNGTTIRQLAVDTVTYYHVELPQHDVVLAEGLAAESYLDVDDRSSFANGGGAIALHPDFAARRWELRWEAEACAPFCLVGPQVEAARAMLTSVATEAARAAA